jgi:hypothetical protein
MSTINLGKVGMLPRGEWSAEVDDYEYLDTVSHVESSYMVKLKTGTVPAGTPVTDTDFYQKLVGQGYNGWTTNYSLQPRGNGKVIRLDSWFGGTGEEPTEFTGWFVGATGFVENIADAIVFGEKGDKGDTGETGAQGAAFIINATGTFAGRSTYNAESAGFIYVTSDTNMLFVRVGTAGNWSTGVPFTAPITMATNRLLGRTSAGSGAPQDIELGNGLTLLTGKLYNGVQQGAVFSDFKVGSLNNPNGGLWKGGANNIGSLRIKIPTPLSNTMWVISGTLHFFDGASLTGRSCKFTISGYSGGFSSGASATFTGNNAPSFPVRWHTDDANLINYIHIGELTQTWSYSTMTIENVQYSYNGADMAVQSSGWVIEVVTSFVGTLRATQTQTLPKSDPFQLDRKYLPFPCYSFSAGYLVKTNIPALSSTMFYLNITGENASGAPFSINVTGYNHGTVAMQAKGMSTNDSRQITVFEYDSLLYFWVAYGSGGESLLLDVRFGYSGLLPTMSNGNMIATVTNAAKPATGTTREVVVTPVKSIIQGDFGLGSISATGTALPSNNLDLIDHPTGFYSFTSTAIGVPTNSGGSVIIDRSPFSNYMTQKAQTISTDNTVRLFARHYKPATPAWTPWVEIFHSGNAVIINATSTPFTKATLNAAYPAAIMGQVVIQDGASLTYTKKDNSPTGNWSVRPSSQLA